MRRRGKSISTSVIEVLRILRSGESIPSMIKERDVKTINILVGKKYLDGKLCGKCKHRSIIDETYSHFICTLYKSRPTSTTAIASISLNDIIMNSIRLEKCLNNEINDSNLWNALNDKNLTWFKYSIVVDKKHNKFCHIKCNFLGTKYYHPWCILFSSTLKTTPVQSQIKRCTQCVESEKI